MAEKSRRKKGGPEARPGEPTDGLVGKELPGEVQPAPREEEEVKGPAAGAGAAGPQVALAEKEAEIAELRSQLLYQQAELENFKKRTEKRYRDLLAYAAEPLLRDLLPVLDNLERALEHGQETGAEGYGPMVEGIGHVVRQFLDVLHKHGVSPVPTDGVRFDPCVHEAVAHMPGEEDGAVGVVCEKGYSYRERLLRPAKVLVTKVAPGNTDG